MGKIQARPTERKPDSPSYPRSDRSSTPFSFPAFCTRHLEAVTNAYCLACFHAHAHDQLRKDYRLRTHCVRDHLVVPSSDDHAIEDHTICTETLKKAQVLGNPEVIERLIERWPFLLGPMVEVLTTADKGEWVERIGNKPVPNEGMRNSH